MHIYSTMFVCELSFPILLRLIYVLQLNRLSLQEVGLGLGKYRVVLERCSQTADLVWSFFRFSER